MRRTMIGVGVLLGLGLVPRAAEAQPPEDTRKLIEEARRNLDEVRRAAVGWERQGGPAREVVDQVVLVPDLATFLDAVASWDEGHYFPILIDDVELNFKFLRAFGPARIVRYPRKAAPPAPDRVWGLAVAAVGRAWSSEDGTDAPPGDRVPRTLGPTPPGVVLASPESPMLAGAVALAAGRFQPLLRWETAGRFADVLTADDARKLAKALEARLAGLIPDYAALGDDCDFVTLAGDWPYRYRVEKGGHPALEILGLPPEHQPGDRAFDDLVGRSPDLSKRWAYCGRLLGDAPTSVYRAMCSLFLQPRAALLFNKYSAQEKPWSDYTMDDATRRLGSFLPVAHLVGAQTDVAGWHRAFDPVNRAGLVLINSHGDPTTFHLTGGVAHADDVPPTEPAAVLMIHSFAASDPTDPRTIAGRWLANGAFVFFGSMHEPFLMAFRQPTLITALIAENCPVVATVRQTPPEALGKPWRLVYLGDPLYRIAPGGRAPARLARWEPVAAWPAYGAFRKPDDDATDDVRLAWTLKTALFQFQRGPTPIRPIDLPEAVLGLRRDRLAARLRPIHDALVADSLLQADRDEVLFERFALIPPAERTPFLRRMLETAALASLQRRIAARDPARVEALWAEIIRAEPDAPADFLEIVTDRVAALADASNRRADWRDRLRGARRQAENTPAARVIDAALKRSE